MPPIIKQWQRRETRTGYGQPPTFLRAPRVKWCRHANQNSERSGCTPSPAHGRCNRGHERCVCPVVGRHCTRTAAPARCNARSIRSQLDNARIYARQWRPCGESCVSLQRESGARPAAHPRCGAGFGSPNRAAAGAAGRRQPNRHPHRCRRWRCYRIACAARMPNGRHHWQWRAGTHAARGHLHRAQHPQRARLQPQCAECRSVCGSHARARASSTSCAGSCVGSGCGARCGYYLRRHHIAYARV